MINAIFKAFTGRAGWLPGFLALVIVALTGLATVVGLTRIQQTIGLQIQQYLQENLADSDSLLGFQVNGRDALLSGQISDPATLQTGLMALPGVRRVIVSGAKSIDSLPLTQESPQQESPQATVAEGHRESANEVNSEMPDATEDVGGVVAEVSSSASHESSNLPVSPLNQPDNAAANTVAQRTATSTEPLVSNRGSLPVSDVEAEGAAEVRSANPEALILSLNTLLSTGLIFSPGDTQISTELASALISLAVMMRNNPELMLGVEGYPDPNVALDKGAFIGFVRARNTEKFLLEQKVEDQRIFTRYLSSDPVSGDDSAQLKFYILK